MGQAIDKCRDAVFLLAWQHPHFGLIHARIRDLYREQKGGGGGGTMGICASGKILIDPDFVMKLDRHELSGVLAHEMLHLVLMHHARVGSRDPKMWNIAADMCINKALRDDDIKLPEFALYPPSQYQGDLYTEALYEWLLKNPNHMPQPGDGKDGEGNPLPTAGCAVIDDTKTNPDQPDWKAAAIEARALAQSVGRGTSAVAALLAPRVQKINWKKVIRHGFELAAAKWGRDWQTFAKRNRRSAAEGPQFPGWQGVSPRIAEVIDVSGSMDRKWIEEIVSETKGLIKQFPGVSIYLVTHTHEVTWEGWLTTGSNVKLAEAVSFSGGTDPVPAYEAVKKAGRFDTLIHFTDCEFGTPAWPEVPARTLVVGAFLRSISCPPPKGAHIIPCGKE